jgi:hypothetical protein
MTTLKRRDTPESREHWEYADRVARQVEAEIRAERARADRISLGRDSARYVLIHLQNSVDHACSRCVGDGELVQSGFVCVRHQLIDFLSDETDTMSRYGQPVRRW